MGKNTDNIDNILYLDLGMGAAGDMLAAALYELLDEEDKAAFTGRMNSLIPGRVNVSVRPETKCGILGTHFDVLIDGEEERSADHHEHEHGGGHVHVHMHSHTHEHEDQTHDHEHAHDHAHHHVHHSMTDVVNIIEGFADIDDAVRADIIDVYRVIADAESEVHGTSVSELHFHEVGMMDAIIDVTAVCLLMNMIGPDKVYASPVRTGKGHMRCAHGILPVPAPATANILIGIPSYAGNISAELCTPTGAALLRHFVSEFRDQPVMTVNRIGYGMGTKDFEICNCIRALLQ